METSTLNFQQKSLTQQGYDYTPEELRKLDWGLRFTPVLCMLGAIYGLATQRRGGIFCQFEDAAGKVQEEKEAFPEWRSTPPVYNLRFRLVPGPGFGRVFQVLAIASGIGAFPACATGIKDQ
jgi:hypothetical protein